MLMIHIRVLGIKYALRVVTVSTILVVFNSTRHYTCSNNSIHIVYGPGAGLQREEKGMLPKIHGSVIGTCMVL